LAALVVLGAAGAVAVWLARGWAPTKTTVVAATSTAPELPGPLAAPPASQEPSPSSTGPSTAAGLGTDPNLVAMDDFTAPALDTAKWGRYESTSPNGSAWKPSQVQVAGGELRIVGTGRNPTGQGNLSGGLCWCGTNGSRTYGKWQVRARFDAGAGYGQIIGLWPRSDSGATDGWIGMADAPDPLKKSVHVYLNWTKDKQNSDGRNLAGDFTAWHVYTVEWRATFVKISVDGKVLYDSTTSTAGPVIPTKPMHLYMQQPVGPSTGIPAATATTPDQVVMHIDWVRLYK
jgi:hypothetical protein